MTATQRILAIVVVCHSEKFYLYASELTFSLDSGFCGMFRKAFPTLRLRKTPCFLGFIFFNIIFTALSGIYLGVWSDEGI